MSLFLAQWIGYYDNVVPNDLCNDIISYTDLLIGAVLVVGSKAPNLITKNMLKFMKIVL